MADKVLVEDDDIEVIEVAELPAPGAEPKRPAKEAAEDDPSSEDADEEDDEEDERLVAQEDDEDDDKADSAAKKKRAKRRQIQKAARDRTLDELRTLRQVNEDLLRRVSAVEGNSLAANEAHIDQRILDTRRDIQTAEAILAKAVEAGNGDDVATALRLRDEARTAEGELTRAKLSIGEARKPKAQGPDPRVASFANEWRAANPWYRNQGGDEASDAVNAIDSRLAEEGYNPATPAYWQELTRRAATRLKASGARDDAPAPPKKKGPPQGSQREHAPVSTRKEVYVTPERKAAMIDAGVWDDPIRRAKTLKAYADFDRENRSAG